VLLPWLGILLLLMLKPNRCAQAWWIWVPVGCVAGVGALSALELEFMPAAVLEMFGGVVAAVGFGLAAVWLIAGYLGWKHRVVAWTGMVVALGGFSLLVALIRHGLEGIGPDMLPGLITLAVGAVVIPLAVTLAGLFCRGRYSPLRICLWVALVLVATWLLVVGPFFIAAMIFNPGDVPLIALVGVVLSAAGGSFAVLLPFLILSFTNAFYRERLKDLLHLGRQAGPPAIPPLPQPPRLLEVEP